MLFQPVFTHVEVTATSRSILNIALHAGIIVSELLWMGKKLYGSGEVGGLLGLATI